MNYKVVSENTLDYIYLHDCIIDNVSILDNNLILEYEHINILPEYPLNNFAQAKYTSSAALIFEDFEVTDCILYDTTNVKKNHIIAEQDALRVTIDIKELGKEFEILEFSKKVEEENYLLVNF